MKNIPYTYKNCPIPGGGYVTGFVFHPNTEGICYARTDIGGIYRLNAKTEQWESLVCHVTGEDTAECYPLSIALNPANPSALYSVCGTINANYLCISYDCGNTWIKKELPVKVHGNTPGRSTGERLLFIDEYLYFASQSKGLLRTKDEGENWEYIDVCENGENKETNLTFIYQSKAGHLFIGCSGKGNALNETTRGCTFYVSKDNGKSFHKMPCPETIVADDFCDINGFVPQRICEDESYLYVTWMAIGKSGWQNFDCYSGDTSTPFDGRLYRYPIDNEGQYSVVEDITPIYADDKLLPTEIYPGRKLKYGLGGLTICKDMLLCTTIGNHAGDIIYASFDKGTTFTPVLRGLSIGKYQVKTPYMKPEYNGMTSMIHWMSDIKVNPFDENMALINTGTGVFCTKNLQDARTNTPVIFEDYCDGIEETVHLHVFSLPSGDVKVIDLVGDLGGFAFSDLDKPCENSFANENGDRYITCINGDFVATNPQIIAVTPRGNWTGKTKGGVLLTKNQCKTWELLPKPYGISDEIDKHLENMQKPNVDSGWVAMAADGSRLLWSISTMHRFASDMTVYTDDEGKNWSQSVFYDSAKQPITDRFFLKIISDRVQTNWFYGITFDGRIFVSTDKGATFYEHTVSVFNQSLFTERYIHLEIRPRKQASGEFYVAFDKRGLYAFTYNAKTDSLSCEAILDAAKSSDYARTIGFGKALDTNHPETMYITGKVQGEYGFYRSHDLGKTFEKINTANQCFGQINCIDGDDRTYGQLYLATGTKGLIYGTMC